MYGLDRDPMAQCPAEAALPDRGVDGVMLPYQAHTRTGVPCGAFELKVFQTSRIRAGM